MKHLAITDYAIFIAYLALTVFVAMRASGSNRSMKDYFLAGRSVNSFIVALTVIAALFSGISYLAAPAEVYQNGIGFGLVHLSFFVATPVTTLWILPRIYNSRYFTAYHFFQDRFSLSVRLIASGLFILRVCLWLAAATYAPALALKEVTGLPLWFTIIATGLISTAYTMKGGMKAVIWTDVLQLGVLCGGQLLILVIAAGKIPGGFAGIWETVTAEHRLDISLSIDPRERITLWSALIGGTFLNLVQMATDQVAVQRYLTAGSLREAQRSLWIKLWLFLPVFAIFYGTGLVLYAFYHHHGDPIALNQIHKADQILPFFVVSQLPAGWPGLLTAAIFAASMSTVSAGVNSLTSATMSDFYQTLSSNPTSDETVIIRRSRWWTLFYGTLVTALAFGIAAMGTNLVESVNSIIGLVGGPMLGLFMLGIFVPAANTRGALTGCLAGFIACLFFFLYKTPPAPGAPPAPVVSFLWIAMIGTLVTLAIGRLASRKKA